MDECGQDDKAFEYTFEDVKAGWVALAQERCRVCAQAQYAREVKAMRGMIETLRKLRDSKDDAPHG